MPRRRLPQPLEPDEVRAILAVPDRRRPIGLRNRTMVALMAESGLRVSEIVALAVADLSPDLERLRVVGSKGGDRVVPLSDASRARLAEWLAVRAMVVPDSAFVFPQLRSAAYRHAAARSGAKHRGSGLSTAYVRAMTARLGRAAGVGRRTNPHAFRHTAATDMIEAQYTLAEVQAVLGHRSLLSTSVYVHVRDRRLSDRLRDYVPGWEPVPAASSTRPGCRRLDLGPLPAATAAAYEILAGIESARAKAFLVLWLAGYEASHARVLALGPEVEVAALWAAAGAPDDAVLSKMVADRAMLDAATAGRPVS